MKLKFWKKNKKDAKAKKETSSTTNKKTKE